MTVLWKDKHTTGQRITPKNFVGPSQFTLQINNIVPNNETFRTPNIRRNYTVTEKADGDRKLLFISNNGKMYFINTNMVVEFTGAISLNKLLFNTIIDGEHIKVNKKGDFINLYAAFDLYYLNKVDTRSYAFAPTDDDEPDSKKQFRLLMLSNVIKDLQAVSIISKTKSEKQKSPVTFFTKRFYQDKKSQSIFEGCAAILQNVKDGNYDYETDGLIFTPSDMGVGSNKIGEVKDPFKTTWEHSFKWKHAEFNTIDFLITTKKSNDGNDEINNIFQGGKNTNAVSQLSQYKTLILRVGYDEKKHGYLNPCQNMIDDEIPKNNDKDFANNYRPMQFYPSNPVDENAGVTNIMLEKSSSGEKIMLTEEGEVIEDNTIVECKYVMNNKNGWKWVPIRVRYDKTAAFRNGEKNYGNAYHVADNNWYSIHNPITEEMITTGRNIPDEFSNEDVYYNSTGNATNTRALRDFHNLFVKKTLIHSVTKPGDTLIDLAVGKGGDFPKWISAKLKFVFGIDISRDNIQNRLNGACARYLNYKKKMKSVPDSLFVHGNSAVNIRDGAALYSDKDVSITKAVFGQGPKDKVELGKGVVKLFGYGENGFNVSSIQFAIHYMFENRSTLFNFIRNVCETTKTGGYFIGTCYDGKEIFNLLREKSFGESISIMQNDEKIWSITKQYDQESYDDSENSLGFPIDVYQESINNTFREYLVNFTYLSRIMQNFGFSLITKKDAQSLNLPSGSGMFSELFNLMDIKKKQNAKRNSKFGNREEYGTAGNMTSYEKKISFLNRYFVFKKTHDVDAEKIANDLLGIGNPGEDIKLDEKDSQQDKEITSPVQEIEEDVKTQKKTKKTVTRKKKKLVLK